LEGNIEEMINDYRYDAKIIKVIDGDTIDAIVDLGFNISIKERFRLYGVDTPETRTKNKKEKMAGLKAKAFVKKAIEGKTVILDIVKGTGKFGRYLAEVHYQIDDKYFPLNTQLVELGYAKEYYGGQR
jgi:micrococcal nuclease